MVLEPSYLLVKEPQLLAPCPKDFCLDYFIIYLDKITSDEMSSLNYHPALARYILRVDGSYGNP